MSPLLLFNTNGLYKNQTLGCILIDQCEVFQITGYLASIIRLNGRLFALHSEEGLMRRKRRYNVVECLGGGQLFLRDSYRSDELIGAIVPEKVYTEVF